MTECNLCHARFTKPSPEPGRCWVCAGRDKRGPEPLGELAVRALGPRPGEAAHKCKLCEQTYFKPLSGDICWECRDRIGRHEARAAAMLAGSGVEARHAKFSMFCDLSGPPPYQRAVRLVERFTHDGDGILALIGRRGTGKTQLAAVAVHESILDGRPARIVGANRLVADLKKRFGGDEPDADGPWLRKWAEPELLAVDEIGEFVAGEHIRAALTELLDQRYRRLSKTLLIGNVTADGFAAAVGDSIADRCNEGGGLILCEWPSFRTAAPDETRQASRQDVGAEGAK